MGGLVEVCHAGSWHEDILVGIPGGLKMCSNILVVIGMLGGGLDPINDQLIEDDVDLDDDLMLPFFFLFDI